MGRKFGYVTQAEFFSHRYQSKTLSVILALIFAVFSNYSLVFLLLLAYGATAQLFPVLLAALIWPRSTKEGIISGLVVGSLITLIFNLFPNLQWQGIHPGIWGLAGNAVFLIAASFLTRTADSHHLRQFSVDS